MAAACRETEVGEDEPLGRRKSGCSIPGGRGARDVAMAAAPVVAMAAACREREDVRDRRGGRGGKERYQRREAAPAGWGRQKLRQHQDGPVDREEST